MGPPARESGARIPAHDDLVRAPDARGRDRDREAHRGRAAARAAGRARLFRRDRRDPVSGRRAPEGEAAGQRRRRRTSTPTIPISTSNGTPNAICKVFDKVRRLRKERREGGPRRQKARSRDRGRSPAPSAAARSRSIGSSSSSRTCLRRLERAHGEIAACENRSALSAKDFGRALREMRSSPLRQRAVARKLGLRPDEIEQMSRDHLGGPQEDQEGRAGGAADGRRAARDRARDRGGRARRREGQGRARRGQPAAGRLDLQEVREPRPAVPRPHSGGQHRPDEGRRQVRLQAGLQVFHLRHLVDPAGHHARHLGPVAHDPDPGPHAGDAEQGHPHGAIAGPQARDANRRPTSSRRSCRSRRRRSQAAEGSPASRCRSNRPRAPRTTRSWATSSRTRA